MVSRNEFLISGEYFVLSKMKSEICTVEPLIMDTPKSGQPPYNGQSVRPLPIYCPYISTSE